MSKITSCAVVQILCNHFAQQKTASTVSKTAFLERLCRLCKLLRSKTYLVHLIQKIQDNIFNLYIYYYLGTLFSCTTAQLGVNVLIYCRLLLCKPCTTNAQLHNSILCPLN